MLLFFFLHYSDIITIQVFSPSFVVTLTVCFTRPEPSHTSFFLLSIAESHIYTTFQQSEHQIMLFFFIHFFIPVLFIVTYSYMYYQINQSVNQRRHVTQHHRLPHRIQDNVTGIVQYSPIPACSLGCFTVT